MTGLSPCEVANIVSRKQCIQINQIDEEKGNCIMETAVTVLQGVLGFALTIGGFAKLILSYAQFSGIPAVAWSKEFKPEHIKLLGVLEVMAGVGLLVPFLLPSLTMVVPLAAVGCALYMAGAMATHLRRSEYLLMLGNLLVFLVPALFVAYGRLVGFVL